MKTVSIIVPVYNLESEYLRFCIDSVLTQDYSGFELILINDGSTNGCEKECVDASKRDSRVKYISQENMGVSVARNTGLDNASGDYILFVDGDDFLSEGILTKLVKKMEESEKLELLFFGYCTNYTNREMVRVVKSVDRSVFVNNRLQLAILQGDPMLGAIEIGAPWGKIVRRSIIEDNKVRYTPGLKKGQDTVFTLNLLEYCNVIDYLPEAGYHYRISTASVSHRFNTEIVEIMEKTIDAYRLFVRNYNKGEKFEQAVDLKSYKAMTNEYLDLYFINKKNPKTSKECKKEFSLLLDRDRYKKVVPTIKASQLDFIGKIEYLFISKKMLSLLWIEKKALNFAKTLIVKNYN